MAIADILGCEIVGISALKGTGIDEVVRKVVSIAQKKQKLELKHTFDRSRNCITADHNDYRGKR